VPWPNNKEAIEWLPTKAVVASACQLTASVLR
jgi:hypothetical protein